MSVAPPSHPRCTPVCVSPPYNPPAVRHTHPRLGRGAASTSARTAAATARTRTISRAAYAREERDGRYILLDFSLTR